MSEMPSDIPSAVRKAEDDLARARTDLAEARELVKTLQGDVVDLERELHGLRSFATRYGLVDVGATRAAVSAPVMTLVDEHQSGSAQVVPISSLVSVSPTAPGGSASSLAHLKRNEAVAAVLAAAPGPMNRAEIHGQCIYAGRDDTIDAISLALTGLKRIGRVEKLGDGLWRLVDTDAPAPYPESVRTRP